MQPFDETDTVLIEAITGHYSQLVTSLRAGDEIRAAFEAAWLSHAVVDGLTPAHHYPYTEKVAELRGGNGQDLRDSLKEKIVMPGSTLREQAHNNWKFWGPKGLMMTHAAFEFGIATIIKPMSLTRNLFRSEPVPVLDSQSLGDWYRQTAQKIDNLDLYEKFYHDGWTKQLAQDIRKLLVPMIVKAVAITWYSAIEEAFPGD